MDDELGGNCNVCGGRLRYGERHRPCGDAVMAAVAVEREHWMRAAVLMLVARSGQITNTELAERLISMVDEKRA